MIDGGIGVFCPAQCFTGVAFLSAGLLAGLLAQAAETLGRRAYARLDQSRAPPVKRLRGDHRIRSRMAALGLRLPSHANSCEGWQGRKPTRCEIRVGLSLDVFLPKSYRFYKIDIIPLKN